MFNFFSGKSSVQNTRNQVAKELRQQKERILAEKARNKLLEEKFAAAQSEKKEVVNTFKQLLASRLEAEELSQRAENLSTQTINLELETIDFLEESYKDYRKLEFATIDELKKAQEAFTMDTNS